MSENSFKIGPCAVIFNGVFVGATAGGAEINLDSEFNDRSPDRIYKNNVTRDICALAVSVEAEVRAVDSAMALLLNANGQLSSLVIGKSLNAQTGELLLIPYNTSDNIGYRFPAAAVIPKTRYVFRETDEHSLLLHFSAFPSPSGIIMEKIAVSETQRLTLPVYPEINPAQVERALTQYIAGKLGLTVDKDIFRGGLPLGVDGVGVEMTEEELSNTPGVRTVRAQVSCRNINRDWVFQVIFTLTNVFPAFGEIVSINNECIRFNTITKNRVDFRTTAESGQIKHIGDLNLLLKI